MRGNGNRNISTLTTNKEAERSICGLRPRLKSKIAKCQQVYSLFMAINMSCNESEMVMADLRLCMSSPGNNFVQLYVEGGGGLESRTGASHVLVSGLILTGFAFV